MGVLRPLKLLRQKSVGKVEFEGHLKPNLKSFLKINHQNICFN